MRALALSLSVLLITLATTEVSALNLAPTCRGPASSEPAKKVYSCRIITGYATGFGQSTSKSQAKEMAMEDCGTKVIDGYIAQRGSIPDDVVADLTTMCINQECQ